MSIATAMVEHLATDTTVRTILATHYHDLAALPGRIPNVANLRSEVDVEEVGVGVEMSVSSQQSRQSRPSIPLQHASTTPHDSRHGGQGRDSHAPSSSLSSSMPSSTSAHGGHQSEGAYDYLQYANEHITYPYRISGGAAGESFGLHVAYRTGFPAQVVSRAHQLRRELEERKRTGGS